MARLVGAGLETRFTARTDAVAAAAMNAAREHAEAASVGVKYLDQLQSVYVQDFYWSAVQRRGSEMRRASASTAANGQSILRAAIDVLVEMGPSDDENIIGMPIRRDAGLRTRSATNEEWKRIRGSSESGLGLSYRSAIVALRQAGGSTASD